MTTLKNTRKKLSEVIYQEALDGANEAIQACGPENPMAFNCGFAWVTIHPANHWFAKYCREHELASKGHTTGIIIWCPGCFNGQQVDIRYAGAKAFAAVVNRYLGDEPKFKCYADSRLD